jgi:Leucine-rich repeat (LRR) protein
MGVDADSFCPLPFHGHTRRLLSEWSSLGATLRVLHVGANKLESLAGAAGLKALENCDASRNAVASVQELSGTALLYQYAVCHWTTLLIPLLRTPSTLDCIYRSTSAISTPTHTVSGHPTLKSLNVSENRISTLNFGDRPLAVLEALDVSQV